MLLRLVTDRLLADIPSSTFVANMVLSIMRYQCNQRYYCIIHASRSLLVDSKALVLSSCRMSNHRLINLRFLHLLNAYTRRRPTL